MNSGDKRKRLPRFLEASLRPKRPRGSSPNPPSVSNSNPPNNIPSNVVSGSIVRASGSTGEGTASFSPLIAPAHAAGTQFPNPQLPTISTPVRNEAFQKAIQEYIDKLSEDDKVAFRSAPDVMVKLAELQQQQGRSGISISHTTLMQRVQNVLQCVKRFLGSIAICIQHHPETSSLVVGGLHCILTVCTCHINPIKPFVTNTGQLALGYIEFFENLTDMMDRIGSHLFYLSRCSSPEFLNSQEIQKVCIGS